MKSLSGGNPAESLYCEGILLQPDVLLVSEPTRGIDIGAKSIVLETISRINEETGVTILFTSSELGELRQVCDRIAIVSGGKVADILPPDATNEEFGLAMGGK